MGLSRSTVSPGLPLVRAPAAGPFGGHAHFWQRAWTRRGIVRGAGALALAGFAGGRHEPAIAQESAVAMPKPIAGGFDFDGVFVHAYDYFPGNQPSTVGDFHGLVAINHLLGEGTVVRGGSSGPAPPTKTGDRLVYDVDFRIMKGAYVGEDGQPHTGTFGFI